MYIIYTHPMCTDSEKIKSLLKEKNMPFKEEVLESSMDIKNFQSQSGHETIPQVYHNGGSPFASGTLVHVGGYEELAKILEK